jgi:hypothetical protein
MLPALAGATVMAILWVAGEFLPNYGFWSWIGAIPYAFYDSSGEDFPSIALGGQAFLVWVLANAYFALGPMVAFMFSRGKTAHIPSIALLLGVITHGCVSSVSFCGFIAKWNGTTVTLAKLADWAWPAFAWIFALSFGGAAVGIALQRIARAIERRADRQNAPART